MRSKLAESLENMDLISQPVDRRGRDQAIELIGQYLCENITGQQLRESWPESSDPGVSQIADELFRGIRSGKLGQDDPPEVTDSVRRVLSRCKLFLGSDLPYPWGNLGLGRWAAIGCITALALVAGWVFVYLFPWDFSDGDLAGYVMLGLTVVVPVIVVLWFLVEGNVRSATQRRIESMASGKLHPWPFESERDMSAVRQGRDPFEEPSPQVPHPSS